MRKNLCTVIAAVILSVAFSSVIGRAQGEKRKPLILGGYSKVATDNSEVVAAADFAISARKEKEGGPLSLVSIKLAERQSASGTNFRLCLEVKAADEDDAGVESQDVQVVVHRNLQQEFSLTSWEEKDCGGDTEGNHASSSYRYQSKSEDELHTPAEGSDERKAIIAAVFEDYKEGDDHPAQFKVNYLKVHNGWAWIDVTPLGADGKPVADPAPLLYQSDNGKWAPRDLNDVGIEGDEHEGPHDPSPKYIKALHKKYPGMPLDIIPKRHK